MRLYMITKKRRKRDIMWKNKTKNGIKMFYAKKSRLFRTNIIGHSVHIFRTYTYSKYVTTISHIAPFIIVVYTCNCIYTYIIIPHACDDDNNNILFRQHTNPYI